MSDHSIRLRVGGWFERHYRYIQRIAQHLRHAIVEPEAGDDCGFLPDRPIGPSACPICGEAQNMLAPEIPAGNNAVNYKLFPLGQVDEKGSCRNFNWLLSQQNSPQVNYLTPEFLRRASQGVQS